MSESNSLTRPLGNNVPLPGGDVVDTPERRVRLPGGGDGGVPPQPPQGPPGPPNAGDLPSPMPDRSFDGTRRTLTETHNRNRALFAETGKALRRMDYIRKGLDKLAEKQDVVSMEDVIHEVSKLVAHGIEPGAIAGILADAPQDGGGEALGGWIAKQAMNAVNSEMQLKQQHDLFAHNMGISAIHLAMAHDNARAMFGGMMPGAPPPPGNNLAGADERPEEPPLGSALAVRPR